MFVKFIAVRVTLLVLAFTILAGCTGGKTSPTAPGPTQAQATLSTPSSTNTPPAPTATQVPLAFKVNGEGVSLSEYNASLKQVQDAQQALGQQSTPEEQHKMAMDQIIEDALLAQAARKAGHAVDDAALQARIDQLAAERGGEAALNDWETRMGYTADSFRPALRRSLEAAWQRDQIMAGVPTSMEQVHARQILVLSEAAAQQVVQQARQAGANFATLAFGYDLSTGGDLGWFPRGYLTQKAIEDAAFSLQPGQVSDVIKTDFGYHILQVIARDPNRPLSPDALQALQRTALAGWLADARKQAQIEELAP